MSASNCQYSIAADWTMSMSTIPSSSQAPQRLGDFEVVRELGRGGMGVVYEARQLSLNRKVALKVLAPGLGLTAKVLERFRREAEAAAKLHHTNIVPVFATGEQDGVHFYAMELIVGPSLDLVIKHLRPAEPGVPTPRSELDATGPDVAGSTLAALSPSGTSSLPTSEGGYFDTIARMVADVAAALDYAHKQGIIHRDVKPSNLLLSPEGRFVLSDFGLARVLEQPGMTVTGEFLGTPAYMSPEQVMSGHIPVDYRTDIYSLGATLYELLTLRPPFTGQRRDQILSQIIHKEPAPPRQRNKQVPRDLETICLKALDKDPDKRYPNAGQMADDLRRYANRFTILARRVGPVERFRKWVRRHPALSVSLALAVIALMTAAVFGYLARQSSKERQRLHEQMLADKLDRAALLARGGDIEAAEETIRDAERLGASPGQVQMLYGQVAIYSGKSADAVNHLQQAIALLPDSVAARALLAYAYGSQGRWDEFGETIAEARELVPSTAEDYYFLGMAESDVDPEKGLQLLQTALGRRSSLLAHLDCANALAYLAEIKGDPSYGEKAIQEAERVQDDLPDNPFALKVLFAAYLETANAYLIVGKEEQSKKVLDRAADVFKTMAGDRFQDDVDIGSWRLEYYNLRGDYDGALAEVQRNVKRTRSPDSSLSLALLLYGHGETQKALAAVELNPGDVFNDLFRCFLLAEIDGATDRALSLCHTIVARNLTGRNFLCAQSMLRLLGGKEESITACREWAKHPDRIGTLPLAFTRRAIEYFGGLADEKQLLEVSKNSLNDQCNAQFAIALMKLSEGRRAEAHEHIRRCVATRAVSHMDYERAKALLPHLDADPNWPKWAP
jgi:serine/threonine protein kinase